MSAHAQLLRLREVSEATSANPQVMRHSHIACHTAALAGMLGRKLTLDPVREEFVGDPEANRLRRGPPETLVYRCMTHGVVSPAAELINRSRRWFEYEQDAQAKVLASLDSVPEGNRSSPEFRKAVDRRTLSLLVEVQLGALEWPPPCRAACLPISRLSILAGWPPTGSK